MNRWLLVVAWVVEAIGGNVFAARYVNESYLPEPPLWCRSYVDVDIVDAWNMTDEEREKIIAIKRLPEKEAVHSLAALSYAYGGTEGGLLAAKLLGEVPNWLSYVGAELEEDLLGPGPFDFADPDFVERLRAVKGAPSDALPRLLSYEDIHQAEMFDSRVGRLQRQREMSLNLMVKVANRHQDAPEIRTAVVRLIGPYLFLKDRWLVWRDAASYEPEAGAIMRGLEWMRVPGSPPDRTLKDWQNWWLAHARDFGADPDYRPWLPGGKEAVARSAAAAANPAAEPKQEIALSKVAATPPTAEAAAKDHRPKGARIDQRWAWVGGVTVALVILISALRSRK